MWKKERDLGTEKLFKCSECGFQVVAKEPPIECPHCGEVSPQKPRSIDLNRSSIEIRDEEVDVYEYDREAPVYRLWYFWVVLVLSVALVGSGLYIVKGKMTPTEDPGTDKLETISFTPPTGWEKKSDTELVGPGEGSTILIAEHKVSKFSDVEEFGQLVGELSDVEDIEKKEVNGIDGRMISWKTRKFDDEGNEIITDYMRYVFVSKGQLYVIMYKSVDNTPEVFEAFLQSISKG